MFSIRSHGFAWYMVEYVIQIYLINKQHFLENNTKVNSKPCQTHETEIFEKNSEKQKVVCYFWKNLHLGCLIRFWTCFWIGFQNSFFFYKPYTCLAFQQKNIYQNPFKHPRWSVFAYLISNSKLLSLYAKIFSFEVLKTLLFRLVLVVMFFIIANIWWDISNF